MYMIIPPQNEQDVILSPKEVFWGEEEANNVGSVGHPASGAQCYVFL
jgi:hypothetical protein